MLKYDLYVSTWREVDTQEMEFKWDKLFKYKRIQKITLPEEFDNIILHLQNIPIFSLPWSKWKLYFSHFARHMKIKETLFFLILSLRWFYNE